MSRFTVSGWVCFRVRVMVSLGNIIKLATLLWKWTHIVIINVINN